MRVLVTRPEASAGSTAGRLADLGHVPVLLPLTKAIHHPNTATLALDQQHSALAVTSAEALRVLLLLGSGLSRHFDEIVYAVGQSTAKAAETIGFRNIRVGNGTGAELAELIADTAFQLRTPILYLAGKPRSLHFEDRMRERSLPFTTAEIYEMRPIAYDPVEFHSALFEPRADAVLLYSRENARLFFAGAMCRPKPLDALQVLCLSDNVADAVPAEFHRNIKIASHPDEEGLFALL